MNKNTNFVRQLPVSFSDGSVKVLPVDTFPVSAQGVYNDQGWPMSDVGILDRFSREHRDKSEIELIAARLEEIRAAEPDNSGKTDAQILREIRPAWVQTASEYADYQRMVLESQSSVGVSKVDPMNEKSDSSSGVVAEQNSL